MPQKVGHSMNLGAICWPDGRCRFRLWAPLLEKIEVVLTHPEKRVLPMSRKERGYHEAVAENVSPGDRYLFRIGEGRELPDPASRFQPEGVHGPSEVVAAGNFAWTDRSWFGRPLRDYVLYELHVGTFTPDGTFEAIIRHLKELQDLGVTALELMPVAQFPGERNWGYDGVYPFAVQNSYGGPAGLKRLVDAAHECGMAVVLDVVYNHLGPEGNYLAQYGPYFTDRYRTPWGSAINFDGPCSDEVRRYFVENALYWQTEFHIDALRLDAVHAIYDISAVTFLEDLARATRRRSEELNRRFHLIAETDLNNARLILPPVLGGYGLDAQWSDDFHHSLHVLLTGEKVGYYSDFGGIDMLAEVLRDGYAYANKYSQYRQRRHGNSPQLTEAKQFVVFSRNHDQIGNRMMGERFSQLVCFESLKLAASAVLLSPFVPLLFMGEEYGEVAPFQYFTSHGDPALVEAVRKGRREEFAAFAWKGEVPDPQDPATFQRSKLNRGLGHKGRHAGLLAFYRELLQLRRNIRAIAHAEKDTMRVIELPREEAICVHYWVEDDESFVVLCFGSKQTDAELPIPGGRWRKELDSADKRWDGPGSSVPWELGAGGSVAVTLPAKGCLLFRREHA